MAYLVRDSGVGVERPIARPIVSISDGSTSITPKPPTIFGTVTGGPIYAINPPPSLATGSPTIDVAHPSSGGTGLSGLFDLFGGGPPIAISDGSHPGVTAASPGTSTGSPSSGVWLIALAAVAYFIFRR